MTVWEKFTSIPQEGLERYGSGITVFKSDQCPYLDDAVNIVAEVAAKADLPFRIRQLQNCEDAQNGVHPYGTFCVLLNGRVFTYHYLLEKEIVQLFAESGIIVG